MMKPTSIKALSNYRIKIQYEDGNKGEVDLSHLAGRGVFTLWDDYEAFKKVKIHEDGSIYWNEEVELCPDATYLKLTGKKPSEIFPKMKPKAHA